MDTYKANGGPRSKYAYGFHSSARVGETGTRNITAYYENAGHTVTDLQAHPLFRKLDIDLHVEGVGYVEVKTDTYTTGNAFIETVSNMNTGTIGNALVTSADFLMYYYIQQGHALVLPIEALRTWVASGRIMDFPWRPVRTQSANGKGYDSIGHIVPQWVLLLEIPVAHTIELPCIEGHARQHREAPKTDG